MEVEVKNMPVQALRVLLKRRDAPTVFDVRTAEERTIASIDGAELLDRARVQGLLEGPKDTRLIFICHTGNRSLATATYFARRGFTDVWNVEGGIDAWSQKIDPSVPRY